MTPERFKQKIGIFTNILKDIQSLSVSQTLKVGCIIIRKDFSKIASIGYNGRYPNCKINPETRGEECSLEPGKSGFVHAELNAMLKFNETDIENYVMLITHSPCQDCAQLIAVKGIKNVYWIDSYRKTEHLEEILGANSIKYGPIQDLENF